jgi:probable F420-dependent oxidoreductase
MVKESVMPKYKVGVQLQNQHTSYAEYADAIQRAEAAGVDSLWNWDHFFPLYGDPDGNHFEGWTLLTAMATLTTRVEIGCLVLCNSYRNTRLLAHMSKTLDHISNGRYILGIGAGWFERDYVEYGYEFGTAGDRLRALGKSLPLFREYWAQEVPKPVRDIPILVGGGGEKVTLKLTAQYATMWNGFGPPETYARKNAILTDWCNEVGRNPDEIERTASLSPDQLDTLDDLAAAGATHMIMMTGHPYSQEAIEKLVAWRDARNAG